MSKMIIGLIGVIIVGAVGYLAWKNRSKIRAFAILGKTPF